MTKRALITGITGQDGSFLAELLLEKGYEVYGMRRRSSVDTKSRIGHVIGIPQQKAGAKCVLKYGDMCDASSLRNIINEVKPDEVYNLAAQSHVRISFEQPD